MMSQAQSSNPSSSNRERFAEPVECKKCGQHGSIFWEENAVGNRTSGSQRELVRISNGFHQEIGRTPSGDPIIACDNCGERLPEGDLTVRLNTVLTNVREQKVQETAARLARQLGAPAARICANDKIKDAILQRDAEKIAFWRDVLDEIKL